MEVKIGELRNKLSRYLRRVRQTVYPIIVLDRSRPVAEIRPYVEQLTGVRSDVWTRRAQWDSHSGGLGDEDELDLPERRTGSHKHTNPLD